MSPLALFSLGLGAWMVLNGILHDVFVLRSRPKGSPYDRELLRLLMDGHILLTCGALQMLASRGLEAHASWGVYVTALASLSLLLYCAMIFPFLKSFGTIVLNSGLLIGLLFQ